MRNILLVQQKSVTKSLYLMDIIGGMTWKESEKLPQRYTACSVATIFSGIRLQKNANWSSEGQMRGWKSTSARTRLRSGSSCSRRSSSPWRTPRRKSSSRRRSPLRALCNYKTYLFRRPEAFLENFVNDSILHENPYFTAKEATTSCDIFSIFQSLCTVVAKEEEIRFSAISHTFKKGKQNIANPR